MMPPSEREPAQTVIAPGETPVHRALRLRGLRARALNSVSAREEHAAYVQGRERAEHTRPFCALCWCSAVVLLVAIASGAQGIDRVFVYGWWRQW